MGVQNGTIVTHAEVLICSQPTAADGYLLYIVVVIASVSFRSVLFFFLLCERTFKEGNKEKKA